MSKCICGCKLELTGKQRMFASDACRQTYRDRKTANHRESPGIDRESQQIDRELTANHREFINKREFKIIFTVVFASGHHPGEWDLGLLDVSTKAEMEHIIQNYLEYVHQGWQITVKLEGKPQFKPFE